MVAKDLLTKIPTTSCICIRPGYSPPMTPTETSRPLLQAQKRWLLAILNFSLTDLYPPTVLPRVAHSLPRPLAKSNAFELYFQMSFNPKIPCRVLWLTSCDLFLYAVLASKFLRKAPQKRICTSLFKVRPMLYFPIGQSLIFVRQQQTITVLKCCYLFLTWRGTVLST